ncbi:MAG: thioredoxin domain-containing protein [Succinivibrio sp.]|nr:thioredoxin domain-containing protein [Succinivibrio sp.]
MLKIICCAAWLGLGALTCAQAGAAEFNEAQTSAIEKIIADYVVNHPELIVQAMQKLEEQQLEIQKNNVKVFGSRLREDSDTPSLGSSKQKNYLIEFFDFNCGYCKIMEPLFKQLSEDKELDCQVMFVNYPLLAQSSVKAATIALAIHSLQKEKYFEFHDILMHEKVELEDLKALEKLVTERLKLDFDKVMDIVKSKAPQEKLTENLIMGKTLSVTGTPYLIINGTEFRGAIQDYAVLKQKILETSTK